MRPTSLQPILVGLAPVPDHRAGHIFGEVLRNAINLTVTPNNGSAPLSVELGGTFTVSAFAT